MVETPARDARAVVFLAWGERYLNEALNCIFRSGQHLDPYEKVLITEAKTELGKYANYFDCVVQAEFNHEGLLRKTELIEFLPSRFSEYLFLDTDTVVVGDISLGFLSAQKHHVALAPAPHYSLDYFWGFNEVMDLESCPTLGQLQYNTGVIFFKRSYPTFEVFRRWKELATKYVEVSKNDQPFFTLAMEQLDFNPYTLSINYNYRGFGDPISGIVRIWHSHGEAPDGLNSFRKAWPRRKAWPDKIGH